MIASCRWLVCALALLVVGTGASAQLSKRANAIAVQLVAETESPAAGSTVTLAFVMRPAKGWHGYWKNPGDAGTETRIVWRLPAGVKAGPLLYPVPDRLTIAGLMNYVYEHDYAQLVTLDIPAGLAAGTALPISAKIDYLACTDRICVPETADVATSMIVGRADGPLPRRAEFDRYRALLPKPLGSAGSFEIGRGRLRLSIPMPASLTIDDPYFFPLTQDAIDYAAPQAASRVGDRLIVELAANQRGTNVSRLEGVLKIGPDQGLIVTAMPGPVPAAGTPLVAQGDTVAPQPGLLALSLLGAVLGGLLLNIMPCVFPILSLKALSLARAGGEESSARHEAVAYGAGVVLTCLTLGGALLALRAGGAAAGWAFQLQDPRVILLLLLLVVAITLNLAGLYELPTIGGGGKLAAKGGITGAFWTGALAAFVATPCTGPFMGAALGAALVLPPLGALAIFAGLGLGLALPFLALGFIPALRRRLPRPGPWMVRFRRWMAVPMALTAAGLAWILSRQSGWPGLVIGIVTATLVAITLWWVGRRQGNGGRWIALAPAAAAMLAAILIVPTAIAPASAGVGAMLGAEPFSAARLAELRADGRPVFVYFTADWCLTCKVNEETALDRSEVAHAFDRHDVAVLVGDWTRGDPAIGRFLDKHGRSGVPLYLYYPPGQPAQILPQLLTVSRITNLVGS